MSPAWCDCHLNLASGRLSSFPNGYVWKQGRRFAGYKEYIVDLAPGLYVNNLVVQIGTGSGLRR